MTQNDKFSDHVWINYDKFLAKLPSFRLSELVLPNLLNSVCCLSNGSGSQLKTPEFPRNNWMAARFLAANHDILDWYHLNPFIFFHTNIFQTIQLKVLPPFLQLWCSWETQKIGPGPPHLIGNMDTYSSAHRCWIVKQETHWWSWSANCHWPRLEATWNHNGLQEQPKKRDVFPSAVNFAGGLFQDYRIQ